jgi:hypothetical protein
VQLTFISNINVGFGFKIHNACLNVEGIFWLLLCLKELAEVGQQRKMCHFEEIWHFDPVNFCY